MFDLSDNPMYSMAPVMPPGWMGVPYMVGPVIADMTGGIARPYVPPNMSVSAAAWASQINNPLYKAMMATVYGQLGAQIGHTASAVSFVKSLGTMAGYSPEETMRALSGGASAFARSQVGSFIMPFVDSGLNAAGLSGGSFVAAGQAVFGGRMNLLGPGTLLNPYDAGQRHRAMAAAAAMATMLNGMMSQRDEASKEALLTVNENFMRGFRREEVAQLAMQAAGMGMFSTRTSRGFADALETGVGGLADRLAQITGGLPETMSRLSLANFDARSTSGFRGTEGKQTVATLKALRDEVEYSMHGLVEAMGAMRDLTGLVGDEAKKLLDTTTNGDWMRSGRGAFDARDSLRRLQAVTQAYNIDPKAAVNQLIANRTMLQEAAGFDASMASLGFSGGGMFGLSAQTMLMASIEDKINARGVSGDPILSRRMRQQGIQAVARSMNTTAGKGAQILAYAMQLGLVSPEESQGVSALLTSGDSAQMDVGINRLLTLVFGSAEAGRRFMNDSMLMNSMRMSMNGEAGRNAMTMMVNGADAEFRRREVMSAADRRLALTKQILQDSGMDTWQSAADMPSVVNSIVSAIRGDNIRTGRKGTDPTRVADATSFLEQYKALVASGIDARTAVSTLVSNYERNPVTAGYAQEINLAIKEQAAVNNEERLIHLGYESRQATALVRALYANRAIDGNTASALYASIRAGNGREALYKADEVVAKLSPSQQDQYFRIRERAGRDYDDAYDAMLANQKAGRIVSVATRRGYSAADAADAYAKLAEAGMRYGKSAHGDQDYADFWSVVSKTGFINMFGQDEWDEYIRKAKATGSQDVAERENAFEYMRWMGKYSAAVQRVAGSTLKGSGHGQQMWGWWGGGRHMASSSDVRKQRAESISRIANQINTEDLVWAKDRDTLATNIYDFMSGRRDWLEALKVYDPENKTGLADDFKDYGVAAKKLDQAYAAYNKLYPDFEKAMGAVKQQNLDFTDELVWKAITGRDRIDDGQMAEWISGISGDKYKEAIMKTVAAHNAIVDAERNATDTLGKTLKPEGVSKKATGWMAFEALQTQRTARLMGDTKLAAFVQNFDFSPEGIERTLKEGGAGAKFLNTLFDNVTDEAVAAELKVPVTAGMRKLHGETAWNIAVTGAKNKQDGGVAVVKAARAAQRDLDRRIWGDLTLKIGSYSEPAQLEGHMGGLE